MLVNAVVDPDEAAVRLPAGVRPHVTEGETVIGCCLLEIEAIRPAPAPALAGVGLRAAAHRISAQWDDRSGRTIAGVYVPMRHTGSRMAVALGGRMFPGVHRPARIDVTARDGRQRWTMEPRDAGAGLGLRVDVSDLFGVEASSPGGTVGETCLGARIGVSPDHRGVLEATRMDPDHRRAREVVIEELDSAFVSGFSTASPAASFVMSGVGVTWAREQPPLVPGIG